MIDRPAFRGRLRSPYVNNFNSIGKTQRCENHQQEKCAKQPAPLGLRVIGRNSIDRDDKFIRGHWCLASCTTTRHTRRRLNRTMLHGGRGIKRFGLSRKRIHAARWNGWATFRQAIEPGRKCGRNRVTEKTGRPENGQNQRTRPRPERQREASKSCYIGSKARWVKFRIISSEKLWPPHGPMVLETGGGIAAQPRRGRP